MNKYSISFNFMRWSGSSDKEAKEETFVTSLECQNDTEAIKNLDTEIEKRKLELESKGFRFRLVWREFKVIK
ncbi:MAG: hypothetical protein ABJC12_01790 [Saprospiraceae bacterium]